MRIIKFIEKSSNFIVILFFLIVIAYSSYALYDVREVYEDTKLSEDVLKYRPNENDIIEETEKFSLEDLQNEINEDICGWIRIDGTNIDYPVLAPKTSLEYLDKDYKKDYSPGGSIFIDYRNDRLFRDDYTAIYGHNMAEHLMFSDIKLFGDKSFFDSHKTGKLYTGNEVYEIKIYTYNVVDSNKDIAYKIEKYKNGRNAELISSFENSSTYKNDIEINTNDKIIMLSTCNGVGTSDRAILSCKLEMIGGADSINEETNSSVDRDVKKKQEEEERKRKKSLTAKLPNETPKEITKPNMFTKLKWKIQLLLKNPAKLILYIIIFITCIMYIVIIKRKIKQNKENKRQGIYNSNVEKHNLEIIRYILENKKENDKNKKYSKETQSESYLKGKHMHAKKYKTK